MLEERKDSAVVPMRQVASVIEEKVEKLQAVVEAMNSFDEWVTPERWETRFEMPLEEFVKKADTDLKIFMGFE